MTLYGVCVHALGQAVLSSLVTRIDRMKKEENHETQNSCKPPQKTKKNSDMRMLVLMLTPARFHPGEFRSVNYCLNGISPKELNITAASQMGKCFLT